ncbi:hypothetical protein Tco_1384030 [Tanacetum coccineum]
MAADNNDQNAEYALSKLLQMGAVAEYQNEFEMLIKRVTIPESLLKSFYISGLKLALRRLLFRSNPKTLNEAFSLALAVEVRFTDLQLLEFLRSYPSNLGEAFFRVRIIEARFEDENNQAVDANVGDQEEPEVKNKQEVKKADDQEIENIQDEEGENVEDQQVSEADDDTNIDDFGCSLSHHKGADLTVEEVELKNIKSDLKEDEDEQGKKKNKGVITFFEIGANKDNNPNGVFNDVGGVGYSKADGTWVPARRIKDGWHLFDELGSKLYFEYSIKNVHQLSDDKHADYKKHKRGIRRGVWDPGIKKK